MKRGVEAVMQAMKQWFAALRNLPRHSSVQSNSQEVTQTSRRRFVQQLGVLAIGLSALKADIVLAASKLIKNSYLAFTG